MLIEIFGVEPIIEIVLEDHRCNLDLDGIEFHICTCL